MAAFSRKGGQISILVILKGEKCGCLFPGGETPARCVRPAARRFRLEAALRRIRPMEESEK
jgi:hypothetical protein